MRKSTVVDGMGWGECEQNQKMLLKPMADGPSFSYEKLVRETWYKKLVRVS